MFRNKIVLGSLVALVTVAAGCSQSTTTSDAVIGPRQADKSTQVHMQFVNDTHQTLRLVAGAHGGDNDHWETQPPTTLDPGQTGFASSYSSDDATINLIYGGTSDGAKFVLHAETPLVGDNVASGTSSNTSYDVTATSGKGWNPTDVYSIYAGHDFTSSGKVETYQVPFGVTEIELTAVGGNGAFTADPDGPSGAQITGTLAVTPGEVLSIGVGGTFSQTRSNASGGWGPTVDGHDYSGGNGTSDSPSLTDGSGGGGGATVVLDPSGSPIVVAGGSGGEGAGWDGEPGYHGGQGGQGGSLTGGTGDPGTDKGGQPGANSTSRGQDSSSSGSCGGGAGGGGVAGGLSGVPGTSGGGGAGSSSDDGLTDPTVSSAPQTGGSGTAGYVQITAVGTATTPKHTGK